MLQYYTLEQAASLLGVSPPSAKKLLDDNKVRQYRDGRGGVRYVASAVDELARSLGRGSDPELPLGEAPRAKTGTSPRPGKATRPVDDSEDAIGAEKLDESASASKRSGRGSRGAGSKSPSPRSPAPKAGTDSDVRLVTEGSALEFEISVDSDVKIVDESSSGSSKAGPSSPKPGAKSSGRKGSPPPEERHGDSSVRIVPLDQPNDSDVRVDDQEGLVDLDRPPVKKHSDSDIRLEEVGSGRRRDEGSDDAHVTEEFDLDAEERKASETGRPKGKSKMKPALPTESPFELSASDIQPPPPAPKTPPDSSSDFELSPAAQASDDALELSSGEMAALKDDSSEDEVPLGALGGTGPGASGIKLDAPMDSGISLEDKSSSEEMEFELSLDQGATPKPAPKSGPKAGRTPKPSKVPKVPEPEDSDSEFELTLDADSSAEQPVLQPGAEPPPEDSDSEFELTLDDSGGLVPLEGDHAAAAAAESGEGGDIFETDFEVPALEEESGSEAVALDESDTDLESSDFDLALEEGDAAADEESGSQVVALEDEAEADEAAETVQRPAKKKARQPAAAAAETSGESSLEELAEVDDEEAVAAAGEETVTGRAPVVAAAAPAPWGPMPALVLLPCVIVMLLAGLMGYELINTMIGYQQPGKVTGYLAHGLAKTFDMDLPKD
jgi:excisionase family DNA binding protein